MVSMGIFPELLVSRWAGKPLRSGKCSTPCNPSLQLGIASTSVIAFQIASGGW